jgi:hypothetical protein
MAAAMLRDQDAGVRRFEALVQRFKASPGPRYPNTRIWQQSLAHGCGVTVDTSAQGHC